MSTYYRPTPNTQLKAVALATFLAGFVQPAQANNDAWSFQGSGLTDTAVSGTAGTVASGYLNAISDGASGAWLTQVGGPLVHYTSGAVATAYQVTSGATLTGLTYSPTYAAPYAVTNGGTLYTVSGATAVTVSGGWPGASRYLDISGTTLFSLNPTTPALVWLALSSQTSGTSGSAATPMTVPSCLAASTSVSAVGVGGWNYSLLSSGFAALAIDPNGYTAILGVTSGSGAASTWANNPGGTWAFGSVVTGIGTPTNAAWLPNGLGAFAMDALAGNIYALGYSIGILSLTQTIPLSGAGAGAVLAGSLHAMICRTAANTVTSLNYSGSAWATGASVAIASPSSIITTAASGMVVGGASGLTALTYSSSGVWSSGATLALGFTPTSLFLDPAMNVYAAGTSGASGYFAIATSGLALTASGAWAGGAAGIAYLQGQTVIGDPTAGVLRLWGPQGSSYVQYASAAAPPGLACLALGALVGSYQDLFAGGSTQAWQYDFTGPFTLSRAVSGAVSVYASGAWATALLQTGVLPQAMAWNPSGQLTVTTGTNTVYTFTSGAVASGSFTPGQAPGQTASALLGLSRLVWLNGHLWAASSLNDSFIEVL